MVACMGYGNLMDMQRQERKDYRKYLFLSAWEAGRQADTNSNVYRLWRRNNELGLKILSFRSMLEGNYRHPVSNMCAYACMYMYTALMKKSKTQCLL